MVPNNLLTISLSFKNFYIQIIADNKEYWFPLRPIGLLLINSKFLLDNGLGIKTSSEIYLHTPHIPLPHTTILVCHNSNLVTFEIPKISSQSWMLGVFFKYFNFILLGKWLMSESIQMEDINSSYQNVTN